MSGGYEVIADDYDKSLRLLPLRQYVEAFSVLRLVGDVQGLDVLDVACGTGTYARALRRAGAAQMVGVDVAEAMIRVAQGIEAESKLGIDYRVGDASRLGRIGSFDLALGIYLLHYAPSEPALRAMCQGIADNLKPGGRFVAFSANPDLSTEEEAYRSYGLRLRLAELKPDGSAVCFSVQTPEFTSPELTIYRWNKATVESALGAAGLCDIHWENPVAAPAGIEAHGVEWWTEYIARPHCILCSCHKAD